MNPARSRRRGYIIAALLGASAAAAACDIKGTPHDQPTIGPRITVLATNVEGTGAVVPSDGALQIAFDRYLLPSTITRQSYTVSLSSGAPLEGLATIYDPVARTVAITGPEAGRPWLTPDQSYRLVLNVPADDSDLGGFRAIDRAPLAGPREYVFRAGPPQGVPVYPPVSFCADVMPIFALKCSDGSCHANGPFRTSGLLLDSSEGVRNAIGRLALGSDTGPLAGSAEEQGQPGHPFGVNMPLVKRGDPGSSWLMYKVELAPHPSLPPEARDSRVCTPPVGAPSVPNPAPDFVPVPGTQVAASDRERAILSDHVTGREMPYPPLVLQSQTQPLSFQERERIRLWIARGAEVVECGKCVDPDAGPKPDGGADAGGVTDAGTDAEAGP